VLQAERLAACGSLAELLTSRVAARKHAQMAQRAAPGRAAELDFFSASFDAALALATPGLEPPVADAPMLDTLAKCRVLLPPEMEESLAAAPPHVRAAPRPEAAAARERALSRQAALAARERTLLARPPLLPALHAAIAASGGPLTLLSGALERRERVRVVTRHGRGVRGVAVGLLRCFDRFFNLVLADVEENYTVRLRSVREAAAGPDGAPGRSRTAHTQEHRRRRLKQVFLRGEHVVLVSLLPPEPGAAAEAGEGEAAA
jgi:small nuclear ribonucleoprotein (snRNP)-like protein